MLSLTEQYFDTRVREGVYFIFLLIFIMSYLRQVFRDKKEFYFKNDGALSKSIT